jgi:glycosyltransferase involved in cell wall biosynthesis
MKSKAAAGFGMSRILVNGRFLTSPATGVQRAARETVAALNDLLVSEPGDASWELVVPPHANDPGFAALPIRRIGHGGGTLWEQTHLARYARGRVLVNLANAAPLAHDRNILLIHDAQAFDSPASYSRAFRLWYRFLHPQLARRALAILTVSRHSAGRLAHNRITPGAEVVPNGFDHILRARPDETVLARHGLAKGRFALAFASTQAHKNVGLILKAFAGRTDDAVLALVGAAPEGEPVPANVKFLGRVNDSELRALYAASAVFLSPSLTEGFGIPPGEAALCGTPVIVARAAALEEIWGASGLCEPPDDAAAWRKRIDAYLSDPGLRSRDAARAETVARAYSWTRSAATVRARAESFLAPTYYNRAGVRRPVPVEA